MLKNPTLICLVFLAAALTVWTPSSLAADSNPTKVFILAGQSNMVGAGLSEELPSAYRAELPNVRQLLPSGELTPLKPGKRFGPEVSFAHGIAKAWPNQDIVLVKLAVGGSSALAWSPRWSAASAGITQNEKQGPLYDRLIKQVKRLLSRDDTEVMAVLWAQGGRDARFEKAADDYKDNLAKIIQAFRLDVGKPQLPILIAHTVDAPQQRFPHIAKVRSAQLDITKEVPHTKLVSSDRLAKHSDNIHFNTEGQIELGRRFAEAFLLAHAGSVQWLGTWQAVGSEECKELRCQARHVNGTEWEAKFTGVCNRRFSFEVAMKGHETKGKIVFQGKTDLGEQNGGIYLWSGEIINGKFTGKYESTGSKNGTFTMEPNLGSPGTPELQQGDVSQTVAGQ